jgi:hypothetical protein
MVCGLDRFIAPVRSGTYPYIYIYIYDLCILPLNLVGLFRSSFTKVDLLWVSNRLLAYPFASMYFLWSRIPRMCHVHEFPVKHFLHRPDAGLIHQLEHYFRILSGSGHINYVNIPLPSILFAFVCSTFRISSIIHTWYSTAACIYHIIFYVCWKGTENKTEKKNRYNFTGIRDGRLLRFYPM